MGAERGTGVAVTPGRACRTTKDVDLLLLTPDQDVHQLLVRAASLEAGDWFRFEVTRRESGSPDRFGGMRFHTQSLLDGRPFERFHVDVGVGDPVVEPAERLATPALLEFADIRSTVVLCYPLTQQLAEKVHAYARPRPSGESSRVKDLVDILLIADSEVSTVRCYIGLPRRHSTCGEHIPSLDNCLIRLVPGPQRFAKSRQRLAWLPHASRGWSSSAPFSRSHIAGRSSRDVGSRRVGMAAIASSKYSNGDEMAKLQPPHVCSAPHRGPDRGFCPLLGDRVRERDRAGL